MKTVLDTGEQALSEATSRVYAGKHPDYRIICADMLTYAGIGKI
jgi:dTDP-D-glucose 4,6-dehydratase